MRLWFRFGAFSTRQAEDALRLTLTEALTVSLPDSMSFDYSTAVLLSQALNSYIEQMRDGELDTTDDSLLRSSPPRAGVVARPDNAEQVRLPKRPVASVCFQSMELELERV